MKFSEVVKRVIELATSIDNYWEAELPKRHPKYPLVDPDVEDPPPPPQEEELRQFLLSRPAEEVYKIRALEDIGSGVPGADYETRWRQLMKDDPETPWMVEFLLSGVPLADRLTKGMAKMSIRGIDVDASPLTAV